MLETRRNLSRMRRVAVFILTYWAKWVALFESMAAFGRIAPFEHIAVRRGVVDDAMKRGLAKNRG